MKPHAFVAMPFGTKPGHDAEPIDFNRVYAEYIGPALEAAGFEVFRADQEQRAGDIRADMFQELLMADLVVADLTSTTPTSGTSSGAPCAARPRRDPRARAAPQPALRHLYRPQAALRPRRWRPDPATLEHDRAALASMATATAEAWHGRKVSPVYSLLPHLREPDWKSLLLSERNDSAPPTASGRAAWRWRGRSCAPATSWCSPTRPHPRAAHRGAAHRRRVAAQAQALRLRARTVRGGAGARPGA